MNRMNFRRFAMMMVAAMLATGAFAKRTSPDVGGKIVDENGNPMSFVSVVLLSMPDSVFIHAPYRDQYLTTMVNSNSLLRRIRVY